MSFWILEKFWESIASLWSRILLEIIDFLFEKTALFMVYCDCYLSLCVRRVYLREREIEREAVVISKLGFLSY